MIRRVEVFTDYRKYRVREILSTVLIVDERKGNNYEKKFFFDFPDWVVIKPNS